MAGEVNGNGKYGPLTPYVNAFLAILNAGTAVCALVFVGLVYTGKVHSPLDDIAHNTKTSADLAEKKSNAEARTEAWQFFNCIHGSPIPPDPVEPCREEQRKLADKYPDPTEDTDP